MTASKRFPGFLTFPYSLILKVRKVTVYFSFLNIFQYHSSNFYKRNTSERLVFYIFIITILSHKQNYIKYYQRENNIHSEFPDHILIALNIILR